jgi:hypothetical protein
MRAAIRAVVPLATPDLQAVKFSLLLRYRPFFQVLIHRYDYASHGSTIIPMIGRLQMYFRTTVDSWLRIELKFGFVARCSQHRLFSRCPANLHLHSILH